jgi:hypothetical protein
MKGTRTEGIVDIQRIGTTGDPIVKFAAGQDIFFGKPVFSRDSSRLPDAGNRPALANIRPLKPGNILLEKSGE